MRAHRREFLSQIGSGMFVASLGSTLALELGLSTAQGSEAQTKLNFGELEPLVDLMQETQVDAIQRKLVEQIQSGVNLQTLIVAGALANARSFGGQDYNGYHAFMALAPALEMSKQLTAAEAPLPVLKVLYRNTNRIQECGGRASEVLHELHSHEPASSVADGLSLQAATRGADFEQAENVFSESFSGTPNEAFNHLQFAIQDEVDVHRTVLAWRSWKMTEIAGEDYAQTLLRQSVRYCVDTEQKMHSHGQSPSGIRELLPALLEDVRSKLREPGKRQASDAELLDLSQVVFSGTREQAAKAAAVALGEGMSLESVGEALSLAANQLLLFDAGRTETQASPGKPAGSVHGASVGVHACDSANAWRNIARVSDARNQFASLIVGAYHTAGQRGQVAQQELPYAAESLTLKLSDEHLLPELTQAIGANDQLRASSLAHRYMTRTGEPAPLFQALLQFAISEEGALHAEKFYRTVQEEYAATRPALRNRHLVALARVSASEFGFPAAGLAEAKQLLRVS